MKYRSSENGVCADFGYCGLKDCFEVVTKTFNLQCAKSEEVRQPRGVDTYYLAFLSTLVLQ